MMNDFILPKLFYPSQIDLSEVKILGTRPLLPLAKFFCELKRGKFYKTPTEITSGFCLDKEEQNYPPLCGGFGPNGIIFVCKPAIYLYPEKPQKILVKLFLKGKLTFAKPAYDSSLNGWQVIADRNGTLLDLGDNKTYSYLFWEGEFENFDFNLKEGFVVEGFKTGEFLRKILKEIGLNQKEEEEFIAYWLPLMQKNPYNLIHFANTEYTNNAFLEIEPKPDSLLRLFMIFKPLKEKINLPVQKLQPFIRKGFTVVEWGGTQIK